MDSTRTGTFLMTASAILWIGMVWLSGAGLWFPALFLLLLLLLAFGLLGSLHRGRLDLRLVAFPALVWLILWAAAFLLGNHYAEAFAGRRPDFTILGFHPSFASIIVFYWVIPTLLMGFGFEAVKERWLPEQRWKDFIEELAKMEVEGRAGEVGDE
jgi:hypothetical protein